ncbi:MAG: lanthionine synthetase LanC family protein, partial [Ilumatobacteraceae bacterium]
LGATLLDDERLAGGARRAAVAIAAHLDASPETHDRADACDVASGLLGAAMALAAAADHGAGADAISAASRLGRLALRAADTADTVHAAGDDTVGVAHGLMGRALAFDRLHAVVGDPQFGDAADRAIEQADTVLRASPDWSGPLVDSWCQGRAGVALAALSLGARCASPSWRDRVDLSLAAVRQPTDAADASACCGRGGAAELLLIAGEEASARTLAATMMVSEHDDWLIGSQPGVAPLLLGFHRGLSGLGYGALRALAPSRYPSALTWR